MDRISQTKRAALMSRIRASNTGPEILVRKLVHSLGFRFRLYSRDLPGKPDLILPRLRLAIFVHGCFWHQHSNCRKATIPATNEDFWRKKLSNNVIRDRQVLEQLENLKWSFLVIWECETRDVVMIKAKLQTALAIDQHKCS